MKLKKKIILKNNNLKFWSGNLIITSNFIGKEIFVYNGQVFKNLKVLELMVGYKMGSFIFSRRMANNIHNSKKYKKK